MIKHNDMPDSGVAGEVQVLDGEHRTNVIEEILASYDATPHVGLHTIVRNAAIVHKEADGEETIELPKPRELRASAAVVRCLMPVKLRGWEIKAMRKIMGLTLTDLAKRLDGRAAAEPVSRWDADTQPMGGYAEKVFRLVVCEALRKEAPGIEYGDGMIANLAIHDPWRTDAEFELPPIMLSLIQMKEQSGSIVETWNDKKAA